jgi:hypothetical protein
MSGHTPGPWCVAPLDGVYHGDCTKTKYHAVKKYWPMVGAYERIADCSDSAHPIENARLIAAAPDLLDALQAMFDDRGKDPLKVVELCKSAILKATGEPSC